MNVLLHPKDILLFQKDIVVFFVKGKFYAFDEVVLSQIVGRQLWTMKGGVQPKYIFYTPLLKVISTVQLTH